MRRSTVLSLPVQLVFPALAYIAPRSLTKKKVDNFDTREPVLASAVFGLAAKRNLNFVFKKFEIFEILSFNLLLNFSETNSIFLNLYLHFKMCCYISQRRHYTQHNDIQHNNKSIVTLSITTFEFCYAERS
jgi:hypothetical protein